MNITEIRLKLMEDQNQRLQAFCSITFDHCFVIRDLKIIQGQKGSFVAMPSRKLTERCRHCGSKNHVRACYCNDCGKSLGNALPNSAVEGRTKLYADIAHPIHSDCREWIQNEILNAYDAEVEKSRQPGYVSNYDDVLDDDYHSEYDDAAGQDGARVRFDSTMQIETPRTAEPADSERISIRIDQGAASIQAGPHGIPSGPHRGPDRQKRRQEAWLTDDDVSFGEGLVS